MFAQCPGRPLHRFNLGSHSPSAPGIEKLACIVGADIGPELLKIFLVKIGPDRTQIVPNQFGRFDVLYISSCPSENSPIAEKLQGSVSGYVDACVEFTL